MELGNAILATVPLHGSQNLSSVDESGRGSSDRNRGVEGVDGLLRMHLTDTGFALRTAGLCCEEEGLRSALWWHLCRRWACTAVWGQDWTGYVLLGCVSKSAKVVLLSVSTWRTGLRMPAYAFQSDDLIHYLLQARGSWDSRVPGSSLLAWWSKTWTKNIDIWIQICILYM